MFRTDKPETADPRSRYARQVDFCEILDREMKPLYLLAFLLTANHKDAEQCFALTIAESSRAQNVFKEWAQPWIKRSLIGNAMGIVSPLSAVATASRELWNFEQGEPCADAEIDSVTQLGPLERFLFVMSVLERYSVWECSLLLGCTLNAAVQARMRALRCLPGLDAFRPRTRSGAMFSRSLQATA